MSCSRTPLFWLFGALGLLLGLHAHAQCSPSWLPWTGVPGADNDVRAIVEWDPDGPGPIRPKVVVGGLFRVVDDVRASRLAALDAATGNWTEFAGGANGPVHCLLLVPNASGGNDLIVGGNFTTVGGVPAASIARWDGSSWSVYGSGINGNVNAIALLPNASGGADLIAAGGFTTAGSVSSPNIARWDGTKWNAHPSFVPWPFWYNCLAVVPKPAGGWYLVTGFAATSSYGVECWDGSKYVPIDGFNRLIPSGSNDKNDIRSMAVVSKPSGGFDLYMAGDFTLSAKLFFWSKVPKIVRWDGSKTTPLPDVFNGIVTALITTPNTTGGLDLVAGGSFSAVNAKATGRVARLSGVTWSPLGAFASGTVLALASVANPSAAIDLYAGGSVITSMPGEPVKNIARLRSGAWQPLGKGFSGVIRAITRVRDSSSSWQTVVGGMFTERNGPGTACLASFDGAAWNAIGAGVNGPVWCLLPVPNASGGTDLYAGGDFTLAGGAPASCIARWDGAAWYPLGSGMDGTVRALCTLPNASGGTDLIAGGFFTKAGGTTVNHIARWDGATWSALGPGFTTPSAPGFSSCVLALATAPSLSGGTDLYAAGAFESAGSTVVNSIALWDGLGWSPLDTGIGDWSWKGYCWLCPLLNVVTSLQAVPSQAGGYDLYAGGAFMTVNGGPNIGLSASGIARWSGGQWSALGTNQGRAGVVIALASLRNTTGGFDILAAGSFKTLGGKSLSRIARWDGTAWSPVDNGVNSEIDALFADPNIGAGGELYAGGEFSITGSFAVGSIGLCSCPVPACADFDRNGFVDDADFALFVPAYDEMLCPAARAGEGCVGDFNNDRIVDDLDFVVFTVQYATGFCAEPPVNHIDTQEPTNSTDGAR